MSDLIDNESRNISKTIQAIENILIQPNVNNTDIQLVLDGAFHENSKV